MDQSATSNTNDNIEANHAGPRTRYYWRYAGIALLLCMAIGLVGMELAGKGISYHMFPKTVYITLDGKNYLVTERQLDNILQIRPEAIGNEVSARAQALNQRVTMEVDRLFDEAVVRVPDYLDWHYSVRGSLSRGGTWAMNKLSWTDERTSGYAQRIFGGDSWNQQILELDAIAQHEYMESLSTYITQTTRWLAQQLKEFEVDKTYRDSGAGREVDAGSTLILTPDIFRLETAASNLGYSALAGALATGGAAIAKQTLLRRAASRGAGRAAGAGAATPCVATGPFALACAVGVFVVATGATELTLITAEEYFERDGHEQVLLWEIERLRKQALYQLAIKPTEQINRDHLELARRFENKIRPLDLL